MFRRALIFASIAGSLLIVGCTNKKVQNPIANINSKQPDKVLYDRAMDAMKHNKFDVARLSLQTLINTYPDSEYVARAKLAIGDSWYAEGGSAAWAQAESEYKDFETFFPNMPEAAEAQLKIANIHYKEMEKADRDPTHARRAEEEYRQLILQYPDSKLVPEAKQRLLEVQEVLADREFGIGHFYYMRESWPAAIARLKSVADTYPLYSGADEALFELGNAYMKEVDLIRKSKLPEAAKGPLIKQYSDQAADAYDRIVTRYPLEERADDAKKALAAMNRPVPKPTPEQIAQDKAEIASRGTQGTVGKMMENFRRGPDVTEAAKVGEPTLVDPRQTSAPDLVRAANTTISGSMKPQKTQAIAKTPDSSLPQPDNAVPAGGAAESAGGNNAAVEVTNPAGTVNTTPADTGNPLNGAPAAGGTNGKSEDAIPELGNDISKPAAAAPAANAAGSQPEAPPQAPAQVNEVAPSQPSSQAATTPSGTTPANSNASASTSSSSSSDADPNTESSSKKKKKHHFPF